MRIHLDTDLGTTMDDLAALIMLLGSPDVELTGVTTGIDPGGRRAGYVRYALRLAGRDDIPVAAGAEVSMTTLVMPGNIPDDERRRPEPVPPALGPAGSALRLLADGVEAGRRSWPSVPSPTWPCWGSSGRVCSLGPTS